MEYSRSRRRVGSQTPGLVVGRREHLGPRGQLDGQRDDRDPDLVVGEAVQRQGGQAGVLRGADAVFGSCSAAVLEPALPGRGRIASGSPVPERRGRRTSTTVTVAS